MYKIHFDNGLDLTGSATPPREQHVGTPPIECNWWVGIMQANQTPRYGLMNDLERKPRFVALAQLHVDFFIGGNHFVLQIPSGAPTELCDHDVAVAEEVDVEIGVGAGLRVG